MALIAMQSGQGIKNAAIKSTLLTYCRNLKKHQNKFQMKTTISSSLAVCAMVSLLACGSPSGDHTNTDSTGAIRSEPSNTDVNRNRDMAAADSARGTQGTVDDRTNTFMKDAAMGGMAEVELGKLAQEKATNPRVKNFGEMMVKDHSAANNDLKSIAQQKNVMLPTDMGKHKDHYEDLSKKKGADFDKAYMKMMVDDHQDDIKDFEKCAENGTDPDVKTFASQKLPTLRKHLDSAKAINKSLK
jgi:putative membrane protein